MLTDARHSSMSPQRQVHDCRRHEHHCHRHITSDNTITSRRRNSGQGRRSGSNCSRNRTMVASLFSVSKWCARRPCCCFPVGACCRPSLCRGFRRRIVHRVGRTAARVCHPCVRASCGHHGRCVGPAVAGLPPCRPVVHPPLAGLPQALSFSLSLLRAAARQRWKDVSAVACRCCRVQRVRESGPLSRRLRRRDGARPRVPSRCHCA
jgi:hypothetical protein